MGTSTFRVKVPCFKIQEGEVKQFSKIGSRIPDRLFSRIFVNYDTIRQV